MAPHHGCGGLASRFTIFVCTRRSAMACEYPDGWGVSAWHGFPIEPKYRDADARAVLAEPNVEMRRVLIQRYDGIHGRGAFIQDGGARVIDSAIQPMRPGEPDSINELLTIDLPNDPRERMVMLKVIDPSTGRTYVLGVPPDTPPRVRAALAWLADLPEKEYVLEQET